MTGEAEADRLDNLGALPVQIVVVDITAAARELYGGAEAANTIAGRVMADHEYRFQITWPGGTQETCPEGWTLTADMIAAGIPHSRSWGPIRAGRATPGARPPATGGNPPS